MRRRALEEWVHYLTPDQGSHSGYVHLCGVERNADKMIPDAAKEQFSDGEIFLLLASILLHDVGRILPDIVRRPPSECSEQVKFPECKVWEKLVQGEVKPCPVAALCRAAGGRQDEPGRTPAPLAAVYCSVDGRKDKPGKTHACRSMRLITDHWPLFGLPDSHIAEHCARIAFWHQMAAPPGSGLDPCSSAVIYSDDFCDTSLEPYGHLRIPLLAAILRIADEAENSWTRALRQHWYNILTTAPVDAAGVRYVDERASARRFDEELRTWSFRTRASAW